MFEQSLKIGYCGETKVGKSHLGARFAKELDGIVLDFAGIQQISPARSSGGLPTYDISKLGRGEAYPACKTGLDVDIQYRYVRSKDELLEAIEYARLYRDTISSKKNHRIWLVIDDTNFWRWHEAIKAMKLRSNAKMITKDDWIQATTQMNLMIRTLEAEFNLLLINQMGDIYQGGESTGERQGKWYPPSIDYALDVVGELWIDRSKKPYTQHFKVIASRASWICLDNFVEDIVNPEPRMLLEQLGVEEELW